MDYSKLSKEVAYALRHAPWEYGLELDAEGWVDINQLLSSLHECEKWKKVSEHDLHVMIEKSDKSVMRFRTERLGHCMVIQFHKE